MIDPWHTYWYHTDHALWLPYRDWDGLRHLLFGPPVPFLTNHFLQPAADVWAKSATSSNSQK